MRKILIVALMLCSMPAIAQWHHHGGHRGGQHGGGWNWVVPAIISGAVVYGATRQDVIIQQSPVIIQPQIPQVLIRCPAGTMPFEQHGWVKNQFGQFVQTAYMECK